MTAMVKKQTVVSQTLLAALRKDGASNRALAERAGISFRALAEVWSGFDPNDLKGLRKRLGVVSTMTRLATCLDVDPYVVLDELGIDTSETAVQRQLEKVRDAAFLRPSEKDPVLRAMQARELAGGQRAPLIGIVSWSPFTDDPGGGSFAKLFARSILGSLNPDWDRETNLKAERNFADAEQRFHSDAPDRPDALFGLYDMPWRRQGEITVIPIPGLFVRVGGLCNTGIGWTEILANNPGAALPYVLTIRDDVGDRLLRGPVDYAEGRLIKPPLLTFDPAAIAARIKVEVATGFKDGFLFIADGPLVVAVNRLLEASGLKLTLVDEKEHRWAPIVRFGFAVSKDAIEFAALLREALSGDLFARALPRTVQLYLRLLNHDREVTNQIGFDFAHLETIEQGLATRFLEVAAKLDNGARTLLVDAARDKDAIEQCFNRLRH